MDLSAENVARVDGAKPSLSADAKAKPDRLDRRRLYIFPTRHGLMLGSMMFVILLGSINYDNALGYLLTFLLFGLFLVAMLHTYRNMIGLRYLGAQTSAVFAGDPARFLVGFDNHHLWRRFNIEVRVWRSPQKRFSGHRRSADAHVHTIAANEIKRVTLAVPTTSRGWLDIERIHVTSTFPLGVLRAWAFFSDDTRCLVYPRPDGSAPLSSLLSLHADNIQGGAEGNDDFAGFRSYQSGDPIRAIAWKILARQDTALVKRFSGGAAPRLMLRWKDCPQRDTEARLSQLCRWVVEAEAGGVHYGLELPNLRIDVHGGAAHRHRCLSALALYGE